MKRSIARFHSRRRFLSALGLGAAAAPLLPLLNASGQESTIPKRLVLLFTPDGAPARDYNTVVDWRPTGTETNFTLHRIHEPLTPHQSRIVVPWGLKLTAGGAGEAHAYGMAGLWTGSTLNGPSAGADFDGGNGHRTGWGSGPSIDQMVARASGSNCPYTTQPNDPVQETPYRTVELGVQSQGPTSLNRMIYAGENAPIHPETSPQAAFTRLFAGVSGHEEDPLVAATRAQRLLERNAVADILSADLTRLRTKVGAEDYAKVDAHLEALGSIQRRINADGGAPPATCVAPEEPAETNDRGGDFPAEVRSMMDILVGALSCDVTRVASLQLSYAFSHVTHSWLGHSSDHHTMSHDGTDRREELQQIDTWYAEQVAYLLGRLAAIPEGDGTLLDNTLIVWGRELGSTAHRMERVPLVLAGGARGALRTGRYLAFDGQEHARLLTSVGQLMGLDLNGVGNRVPNSGGLSGLG